MLNVTAKQAPSWGAEARLLSSRDNVFHYYVCHISWYFITHKPYKILLQPLNPSPALNEPFLERRFVIQFSPHMEIRGGAGCIRCRVMGWDLQGTGHRGEAAKPGSHKCGFSHCRPAQHL